MGDSIGGLPQVVYPDGSVGDPAQQAQSASPPGFAHSRIVCGPGETQLLPFGRQRIFASIGYPPSGSGTTTVLLSVGESFASTASYTVDLAPGDYFEVPPAIVVTAVHVWNPGVGNVTLTVTEGTISTD